MADTNTPLPISGLPAGTAIDGSELVPVVQQGKTVKIPASALKGQKGDTGATGAKGDTGAAGAKGDTGTAGKDGTNGTDGTDGKDGVSFTPKGNIDLIANLPSTNNADGDSYIVDEDGNLYVYRGTAFVKMGKVVGANGAAGAKGDKGDKGDTGAKGDKGDTGDTGVGFNPKGEVPTKADLPTTGNSPGDTYIAADDGAMYVWVVDGSASAFVKQGTVKGAKGDKGDKGDTGATGAKGDTGATGAKGDTGAAGAKGDKGDKGDTGLGIKMIDHLDDESQLPNPADYNEGDTFVIKGHYWTLANGAFIDLGDMTGPDGKSSYQLWLDDGNTGTVEDYQTSLKGADGIGLQIRGSFGSTNDLPTTGQINGDAYIINQQMYVWDGTQWSIVGQVGPQGIKGDKGDKGEQGAKGDKGDKGDTGAKGDKGDTGATGAKGDQGEKGDMGAGVQIMGKLASTGDLPATGTLGQGYLIDGNFWGWTGSEFENLGPIQGPKGDTGATGAKGDQGDKGDKGDQGTSVSPRGTVAAFEDLASVASPVAGWLYNVTGGTSAGHQFIYNGTTWIDQGDVRGAQGTQGTKGDTGATGAKGDVGAKGDTGAAGAKGDTGATGAKGDKGDTGQGLMIKGSAADAGSLPATGNSEGDAYVVGDNLYVYLSGTWTNTGPFRGPKGDTGATGAKGDTGATGAKGDKGDTGTAVIPKGQVATQSALPTAAAGNNGWYYTTADTKHSWMSNGTAWIDMGNMSGAQGIQGVKGDTGATGAKGDTGATGTKGDQGIQGDVGPQGNSIIIRGHVDTVGQLPTTGNLIGATYTVTDNMLIYSWDGTQWNAAGSIRGPQGDTGATGPTGPVGAGIKILGSKATTGDLPTSGNTVGDGYLVGANFYVWDGTQWANVGPIQGPKGDTGARGLTGAKGDQGDKGNKGDKGDAGTKWIVFARDPSSADGVVGDYFLNSSSQAFFQKTSTTAWSQLGTLGGGNVFDANFDGKAKVRKDGQWIDLAIVFDRYDVAALDVTGTTLSLDVSKNNVFRFSGTSDKGITFANLPASARSQPIVLIVTGKGGNMSWTNTILWSRGEAVALGDNLTIITLLWTGSQLIGQVGMSA